MRQVCTAVSYGVGIPKILKYNIAVLNLNFSTALLNLVPGSSEAPPEHSSLKFHVLKSVPGALASRPMHTRTKFINSVGIYVDR
eukprot:SAG31_NODE_3052_length_4740_cov_1.733894_3_plen_84_part_00